MSRAGLAEVLRVVSAPCREHAPMMHDAIDGRANWGARAGLRLHLFLCGPCRHLMRQLRFVHTAARAAREDVVERSARAREMPAPVRDRLRARLRAQANA